MNVFVTFDGLATFFRPGESPQSGSDPRKCRTRFFLPLLLIGMSHCGPRQNTKFRHAEFKRNGFKGPKIPCHQREIFAAADHLFRRRPRNDAPAQDGLVSADKALTLGHSHWPKLISQSATCRCHLGRPQWTCSADSSPTESGRQILGNSSFTPCFDTYSLETRQFFPTSTIKVCRIPPPIHVSDQWNRRINQKAIRHHLAGRRNQSRTR